MVATTGDSIVRVDGLTKRFAVRRTWRESVLAPRGGTTATVVDRVSFDVREGEIFGLLGQNGAGKTTIFKMLTTLILPDAGRASVAGLDVVSSPGTVRRVLAPVIANERSLHWRLSARENVRLYTALQGLAGQAARNEESRVLDVVGLADAGQKLVGAFSSGMRQRLLLARALIAMPRVLLLDEPTRSLDPISARDFRQFLRDTVVRGQGCTVLLATHDADEVWELCDRVGVLERGRLLEVGETATLRDRTASERYRAWVAGAHADAAAVRARGVGFHVLFRGPAPEEGWVELEFDIPGGPRDAARVLAALTNDGGPVARFERVAPTLADLIERIVRLSAGGRDGA
jgi:ABC-2 type transport system ATP-binding protein